MKARMLFAAAVAIGLCAGCDRGPQPLGNNPSTRPSTEPSGFAGPNATLSPASTTQPSADSQLTVINIGQRPYWFPTAILRLTPADGHLTARLTSDDPASAIEDNYHGNSFDLDMPLGVADASQINQAVWVYKAASIEQQEDSPHGIFLNGQRQQLHPQDVTASFKQTGSTVIVTMVGKFLMYDTTQGDRAFMFPQSVLVQAKIQARVSLK